MHYEDFVLQIDANSRGGFWARVLKSPFGEGATSFVLPAMAEKGLAGGFPLAGMARDVVRLAASPKVVEPPPTEIGTEIYRAVFQGSVRSLLDKCRGQLERSPQSGLRLKIKLHPGDPDTVATADLPWELLCDGDTEDFFALSRQTSLVRYLDVPRRSQPIPFTPPLRILAVSASPKALPPLDLAEEARRIDTLRQRGLPIEVHHLVNASAGAMREALVSDTWHVLHFMGHGQFEPATGEGLLAFEGAGGRLDLLSGRAFATKLKGLRSLGVVVLNACNTARAGRQGEMNPFRGVATALVLGGVPAVVAMQQPISDLSAIGFSTAFHRHLARGDSIDEALIEGRQAIHSAAPETFEWAIPVLFLRIPEGNVFEARPAPEGPAPGADLAAPSAPAIQTVQLALSGHPALAAAEPVRAAVAAAPGRRRRLLNVGAGAGAVGLIACGIYVGILRSPQAPPAPGKAGKVMTPPPVSPVKTDQTVTKDAVTPKQRAKAPLPKVNGQPPSKRTGPGKPGGDGSQDAPPAPADLSNLSARAIAIARQDGGGLRVTATFRNSGNTPLSLILNGANAQLADDQGKTYIALGTSLPLSGGNPRLDLAAGASLNIQFDFPTCKPGSKTFELVLATVDNRPINVKGTLTIEDAP